MEKPVKLIAKSIDKLKELGGTDAHETMSDEQIGMTFVVSHVIEVVIGLSWLPQSTDEQVRAINDYCGVTGDRYRGFSGHKQ